MAVAAVKSLTAQKEENSRTEDGGRRQRAATSPCLHEQAAAAGSDWDWPIGEAVRLYRTSSGWLPSLRRGADGRPDASYGVPRRPPPR